LPNTVVDVTLSTFLTSGLDKFWMQRSLYSGFSLVGQ